MKRKFLEDMGLEKEQVDKILDENSQDIGKAKGDSEKIQKDLDAANAEVESLKGQISDRDKQLETVKNSTGDVEAMKQQIATLQADNKAKDEEHAKELMQLKVDTAVEKALTGANAKNIKAVRALLDLTDAKLDKDGNVKGLSEQIEKLTTGEDTKFLFDAPQQKQQQTFKGFQPGASAQQKPGTEVDTSKMNYDELCAYLAENPDAKLE